MESNQVTARMIVIIGHFAADGRPGDVHVEHREKDGNADALAVEKLILLHFSDIHHVAVAGGNHQVLPPHRIAARNAEETKHEDGEPEADDSHDDIHRHIAAEHEEKHRHRYPEQCVDPNDADAFLMDSDTAHARTPKQAR